MSNETISNKPAGRVLDLTSGSITGTMLRFALPMIAGNLLQQLYNVADTLIVGRFLGSVALAAVGSSYTLMTFLTSILLGLCMGSGAFFSIRYGEKDFSRLRAGIFASFTLIAALTFVINAAVFLWIDPIMRLLSVPVSVYGLMREYLWVIFFGIAATFLYNFFACLLRAVGNSAAPLIFLGISAVLNIVLDLVCVLVLHWGVAGAAAATVFAQWISGIGLGLYTLARMPGLRVSRSDMRFDRALMTEISHFSLLTCMQQSVMNFGILMVQGLVNSFGPSVMAAFAAAVKIDSFAYMPVQDFGNAFSTFIAQNYGAKKEDRIRAGIKSAVGAAAVFCLLISTLVFLFARPLLLIFIRPEESEILSIGVEYLRIEGAFYCGIGALFLLYGLYRAIQKPGMSLVLTVISLGTRVVLAYTLRCCRYLVVRPHRLVPCRPCRPALLQILHPKKSRIVLNGGFSMEIRNVTSIFFSPTGSTRRLVSMLSKTFPSKPREVDITPYTQRGLSMDFGPDDLVLFGVPVYGGRIPSPAVQTLRRMQGSRTPAVLVAAYGNREYDDALLELADIAAANGFIPFAAAALIAEHSIMHSVAAGRPDAQDAKKIEAFGTQLWKKLSTSEALSPVSVKGTRPYKEFGGVPMKPKAGRSCTGCGICAALCPAHAIPANVPSCTDKDACISCMRCIKVCPVHARRLNPVMLRTAESAFYQKHNARREPEFIL